MSSLKKHLEKTVRRKVGAGLTMYTLGFELASIARNVKGIKRKRES